MAFRVPRSAFRFPLLAVCLVLALAHDQPLESFTRGRPPTQDITTTLGAAGRALPFETPRGHLIAVRGAIGPLGALLLVDTGTSRTVVDRRIAQQLGLRGTADVIEVFGRRVEAQRVAIPPLTLGPIQAAGLSVLSADLSGMGQRLGGQPDAIVGLDVLRGNCLVIDYRTRTLSFTCSADWEWNVVCDTRSFLVTIDVSIDGTSHKLLVDTGRCRGDLRTCGGVRSGG
jgi:predicted aspartyl protease